MITLLLTAALAGSPAISSVDQDPDLFATWIARRRRDLVRSSVWGSPTEPERIATAEGALALVRALPTCDPPAIDRAAELLHRAGWILDVHEVGGAGTILVVSEREGHGGGLSAWRCGEAVPIVAQAPHADYDLGTDDIVRHAFTHGGLRGVMWSTVRRYHALPGERDIDPIHPGDVAHQPASLFQTWTLAALVGDPATRVVQIHGFAASTLDADAVISSGRADAPPVPLLAPALAVLGPEAPRLRLFGHDVDVLGATTNAQARAVVRLPAPRFVHVELSPRARALLVDDAERSTALLLALGATPWSY